MKNILAEYKLHIYVEESRMKGGGGIHSHIHTLYLNVSGV